MFCLCFHLSNCMTKTPAYNTHKPNAIHMYRGWMDEIRRIVCDLWHRFIMHAASLDAFAPGWILHIEYILYIQTVLTVHAYCTVLCKHSPDCAFWLHFLVTFVMQRQDFWHISDYSYKLCQTKSAVTWFFFCGCTLYSILPWFAMFTLSVKWKQSWPACPNVWAYCVLCIQFCVTTVNRFYHIS